jgi:hypothetical protein
MGALVKWVAGILAGVIAGLTVWYLTTSPGPGSPPDPSPTSPPPAESAQLTVVSSPTGATVEVGLQAVDGVVTSGTGRVVGTTPITSLELTDADVSYGSVSTNLYVELRLDGYVPALEVFGLSDAGLEAGNSYEIDTTLSPL